MRLCARLTRAEFTFLARSRATGRAPESLDPFESRFSLHAAEDTTNQRRDNVQLCTVNSDRC